MSETTTWYELRKSWATWKIEPIQVVKQTPKGIVVRETWSATSWAKAGTKDRRRLFDGNQFDNLEAANASVRDRLRQAYEEAFTVKAETAKALGDWKDVVG